MTAPAHAAGDWNLSLRSIDGSPIRSRALSISELMDGLEGAQIGAPDATPQSDLIVELFDYNCGFCREAARPLEQFLTGASPLRLVRLHLPVLGPGSREAAIVQQTVFRLHGFAAARQLHLALLDTRGPLDGGRALEIARGLGMNPADAPAAVRRQALDDVTATLQRAAQLHLKVTPTFVLANTAFIGWPGVETLQVFIAAKQQCGALTCG